MGSEGPAHGYASGAEMDIDDLPRNDANYTALTSLWFLVHAALAQPDRASVGTTPRPAGQGLASTLAHRSIGHGMTLCARQAMYQLTPALFVNKDDAYPHSR